MNKKIKIKAFAKINLALAVMGSQGNMHKIDSIVTNVALFDTITLQKREDNEIKIEFKNIDAPADDTAKRMAELIQKTYNTCGVNIHITKNIPLAAGLGGSSADAAGVAKGMQKLYNLEEIPNELLLKVGSDVPYMYYGGNKRIRGLGEQTESIVIPKTNYALVVCPGGVSTAKAYSLYDVIGGENPDIDEILRKINANEPYDLANALQRAAERLNPNITKGIEYITLAGFTKSVMTGSGSCVVGIEPNNIKYNGFMQKLRKSLPEGYKLYKS